MMAKFKPGDKIRHSVSGRRYEVESALADFLTVVGYGGTYPYHAFELDESVDIINALSEINQRLKNIEGLLSARGLV